MDIKVAIAQLMAGQSLSREAMSAVMTQIMTGEATQAQIGGFLVALTMKGETVEEITGAAQVMRRLAAPVNVNVPIIVDTCGTGGDGAGLFNVSTAAAFVVAAAGGYVAKHGNRSITSSTGSADLLEAAGVNLNIDAEQVSKCVESIGVGFMFAPAHHSAMKHAIGPRKELGLRTIFNVLGPLTNPAGAKRQVLGVFDKTLCRPLAEVLQALGSEHVMVVSADDGLDEISLAVNTHVAELKEGVVSEYEIYPGASGIEPQNLDGLTVKDAQESLELVRGVLGNAGGERIQKASDMVAINAGAALYVAGVADSYSEGVALAQDTLATGLAGEKLKELVEMTACFEEA
ncbi:anthranilate phosphoribosyltransferase [Marinagarivorans cellulosilyticus]|uniref:Anthranilate phosphoribosyltransferase n=1 Tax=Marinagarivorans cellulosilyticus TaxID=2721545 RepID=A0AAN2BKV4_9GAMM|nr:anthranilate phosphoribosyltransferase [Marinagarivorans cellulosilyticus]BCD98478.1 anthranilate phosphoribosyltransferase [Marinagarivorans cellulosilyticus]